MNSESEAEVWDYLTYKGYENLRSDMVAMTREVLGSDFNIRSLSFARSSIEIFIAIGTVGAAIYMGVSRYKNFVENIKLLASQLDRLVQHFLDRWRLSTSVTREPTVGVPSLGAEDPSPDPWAYWLLLYVIITHAVLRGLLIWLLVRRVV